MGVSVLSWGNFLFNVFFSHTMDVFKAVHHVFTRMHGTSRKRRIFAQLLNMICHAFLHISLPPAFLPTPLDVFLLPLHGLYAFLCRLGREQEQHQRTCQAPAPFAALQVAWYCEAKPLMAFVVAVLHDVLMEPVLSLWVY